MLKILQARLQQYVNRKLPDVQAEPPSEPPGKPDYFIFLWAIYLFDL